MNCITFPNILTTDFRNTLLLFLLYLPPKQKECTHAKLAESFRSRNAHARLAKFGSGSF